MITACVEELTMSAIEEMQALFPRHYEEVSEHHLAGIPLDPQYDIYLARSEAGNVLYVALREAGTLIGYLVSFVAPGLHYRSCLTVQGDIFFVYPDRRGLEGGKTLFSAWLKECRRRGIRLAQIGIKTRHAKFARPLIEAMGFVETEIMFWQFLDKDER